MIRMGGFVLPMQKSEGVLSEGVLSEGVLFEGVLSEGVLSEGVLSVGLRSQLGKTLESLYEAFWFFLCP